ncbi:hypothetical protein PEX1_078370 [Penicillium expansum]|uniref:Uncharacterized protein n=1 Tax=Penicillium expansum TaxID=27334 RepID=A0A0A2KKF5_PENEN|nr:hypothetical protein PEX2_065510 [Penicillium expansum]KGO44311.1 hypothetical protein PEXP_000020 [Penicillium expansum]KGO58567.1 hypothetical protein PEX2_065510 [Penicillium expansum]KGO68249.1 hypothetical protein PEX1_078370 [Penicillium expansum]
MLTSLSAMSFNPFVAHVHPGANPVPTLPRALLRKDLLDQEQTRKKTDISYQILSSHLMKVHYSIASSPCQ